MDGGGQRLVGGRHVPIPGGHAFVPDALPPRVTYTAEIDDEELGRRIGRADSLCLVRKLVEGGILEAVPAATGERLHVAPEMMRILAHGD